MNYTVHITVHVYAEEKLDDHILTLHSNNYGIVGKEIIAPLRKINGKDYYLQEIPDSFSVEELWKWINLELYRNSINSKKKSTIDFAQEYDVTEKYLVFNNLRYTVDDTEKSLLYYIQRMGVSETEKVNVQLLVNANAGTIFSDDGIRYYMNSREAGKHNLPHIHVDIRHEEFSSFSLIDGKQLSDEKIKTSDRKKIERMIADNKEDLIRYWNEHTDGLTVDLNQSFGLIQY